MADAKPDRLLITVDDGKYTVVQPADGGAYALRYGEPWRDCCGDNLILALAYELEEARKQLTERSTPPSAPAPDAVEIEVARAIRNADLPDHLSPEMREYMMAERPAAIDVKRARAAIAALREAPPEENPAND